MRGGHPWRHRVIGQHEGGSRTCCEAAEAAPVHVLLDPADKFVQPVNVEGGVWFASQHGR